MLIHIGGRLSDYRQESSAGAPAFFSTMNPITVLASNPATMAPFEQWQPYKDVT